MARGAFKAPMGARHCRDGILNSLVFLVADPPDSGAALLFIVEGFVERVSGVERSVVALGDDLTPVENENHRGIADGAETVGDDQDCLSDDEFF